MNKCVLISLVQKTQCSKSIADHHTRSDDSAQNSCNLTSHIGKSVVIDGAVYASIPQGSSVFDVIYFHCKCQQTTLERSFHNEGKELIDKSILARIGFSHSRSIDDV